MEGSGAVGLVLRTRKSGSESDEFGDWSVMRM